MRKAIVHGVGMSKMYVKALHHQHWLIKCSIIDHFTFRAPVPVVFFYSKAIDSNTIIKALQHVLNDFPIFAGVLVRDRGQLYIDCNNQGVSVQVVHLQSSMVQQLANFPKLSSSTLVDLFDPYKSLKQRKPVLTIKITYFSDGMAIGYCWHHSIGDMSTFMELLKAVSAFSQGKSYEKPVILEDRESYLHECQLKGAPLPKQDASSRLKCLGILDVFRFIKGILSPKRNFFMYFTQEEVASLRDSISEQTGRKISRNEAVCAHLLDLIAPCRSDPATVHHASIIVNFRKRIGLPLNVLGNCVDVLKLTFNKPYTVNDSASSIHSAMIDYRFHHSETSDFIEKNGGIKNVGRIIPKELLPQYKNLIVTNWSNFGVYSIDFGVAAPIMFMPTGKAPFAWVSCIVEGFKNKGLLVVLVLPSKVAKRFATPATREKIHKYRPQLSPEDTAIFKENSWCI